MKNQRPIKEPPTSLLSSIRFLGPGLILSAAIVGSGELIATTTLGAQAGFVMLWVILVACFFKVALQIEYGRYAIMNGQPSFQAWNRGRGLQLFGLNWSVYVAVLFLLSMCIGQGGVIGSAAQVGYNAYPQVTIYGWTLLTAVLVALLIFHGKYKPVEIIALLMNALFIGMIFYCVVMVQKTPYAYSTGDVASGLLFQLPPEGAVLALSAFGIVGLSAGEIVTYPYWCLEKGYAAWCGPNDGSPEWIARAKGWMAVMKLDALVSMLVYTLATCAFYILGAAVLSSQETLADGNEFILQLSALFTEVLGPNVKIIFMVGAFVVLFSTAFANTAGFSRMWTDVFGLANCLDVNNPRSRKLSIAVMAWVLPFSWGITYLFMQSPFYMIVIMGICNTLFLLVVAFKALVFRYRFTPAAMKPSVGYDIALWIAFITINGIGLYTFYIKILR
jgi:manganese transport protein